MLSMGGPNPTQQNGECSAPDCTLKVVNSGMCTAHASEAASEGRLWPSWVVVGVPPKAVEESIANTPTLASEWHPTLNVTKAGILVQPNVTWKRTSGFYWWTCHEGHVWKAAARARSTGGNGCPFCVNRLVAPGNGLADLHPDIAAEWDADSNGSVDPRWVAPNSHAEFSWKCRRGHMWDATVKNRVAAQSGCPKCSGLGTESRLEVMLRFELAQFLPFDPAVDFRVTVPGLSHRISPDILLPADGLVVEYDGAYYHSDGKVAVKDNERMEHFASVGLRCVRIREYPLRPIGSDDIVVPASSRLRDPAKKIADAALTHLEGVLGRRLVTADGMTVEEYVASDVRLTASAAADYIEERLGDGEEPRCKVCERPFDVKRYLRKLQDTCGRPDCRSKMREQKSPVKEDEVHAAVAEAEALGISLREWAKRNDTNYNTLYNKARRLGLTGKGKTRAELDALLTADNITTALAKAGTVQDAAVLLDGVSVKTLKKRMEQHGIPVPGTTK